ncbi:MAG: 2-iminobutanoate/2-iminopropanoate deaminase [Chloroflexi bacterium]|jgi:2-iminobutanoate/2-iminopropanoate deaminase|nr:MAG: 2-iminobutanoate/2-iminopropanoate deaminase [Chloroflexota bacterium]
MPKRQIIEVPGVAHNAPIPMAVKIGNTVYSSGIIGADPATGEIPEDAAAQTQFMFQHIGTIMEQAGGSTADIAHMTVYVKDNSTRQLINAEWLKMFPDENDRPARHAIRTDELQRGMLIQCEIVAVLD